MDQNDDDDDDDDNNNNDKIYRSHEVTLSD
jgi:hypothetical protein